MSMQFAFTVSAGSSVGSPSTMTFQLWRGEIEEIALLFPAGCGGEVALALYDHEQQAYPLNPSSFYIGDDTYIVDRTRYRLRDPPYALEARGWSPTASYDHTIYIRISMAAEPYESVVVYGDLVTFLGAEE